MTAIAPMRKLLVAAAILTLVILSATASAGTQKTIFYNLTTEEAWGAGMALGQANKALESGYKVIIFLNVRGVFIASKVFKSDSFADSGKSLQDLLKSAMDKGAQVIICPMCMKKAGMTMDDVIKGVVEGGPNVTMKAMTAENTAVISF